MNAQPPLLQVVQTGKGVSRSSPVVVPFGGPGIGARCEEVAGEANRAVDGTSWLAKDGPPHLSLDTSEGADFELASLGRHLAWIVRSLAAENEAAFVLGVDHATSVECLHELAPDSRLAPGIILDQEVLYGIRGRAADRRILLFLCPQAGAVASNRLEHPVVDLREHHRQLLGPASALVQISNRVEQVFAEAKEQPHSQARGLGRLLEDVPTMAEDEAEEITGRAIIEAEPSRLAAAEVDSLLRELHESDPDRLNPQALWPDWMSAERTRREKLDRRIAHLEAERQIARMVYDRRSIEHDRRVERWQIAFAIVQIVTAGAAIAIAVAQIT